MTSLRAFNLTLLIVLVSALAGCSSKPASGSVEGKVTVGGKILTAATIVLINDKTGVGASTALDKSGSYQIEAVPRGDYQVAIQAPPPPAPHEMDSASPPTAEIPPKYRNPATSGLSTSVSTGVNRADFAL